MTERLRCWVSFWSAKGRLITSASCTKVTTSFELPIIGRFIYPTILALVVLRKLVQVGTAYFKKWSVHSLEAVYLVEKKVMNMEDAQEPGSNVAVQDSTLTSEQVAAAAAQ